MKKMITGFALLFITGLIAHAQLPKPNKATVLSAASPGKLLTQFTNAISPSSFTSAFTGAKGGILSKAQKVTNAIGVANTVSSLAGYIQPAMFKQGSTAQNIVQLAGKVKTMTDAAGLLKNFEGSLQPQAFTNSWSGQRPGWLNALSLLK